VAHFLAVVKGSGAILGLLGIDTRQRGHREGHRQRRRPDDDEGADQLTSGEPGPQWVNDARCRSRLMATRVNAPTNTATAWE